MNYLTDFIKNYTKKNMTPFHMPGHKRNKEMLNFDPSNFLDYDITEIVGADNLLNASGIIRQTEEQFAKLYGAEKTFMLVNGSSCGIVAAILATVSDKDAIIMARNSHVSAYNGVGLSGARPIYVSPEMTDYGFCGGVSPLKIDRLLEQNADAKAVFITSPTYEGICSDVCQIAKIVHKHGKVLIVDEAHGAHFGFSEHFPQSAVRLGADIVIQSLHKTLPTLTQTALLHVNGERVNAEQIKNCLSLLQTTSPSYVLMASMGNCADLLEGNSARLFANYYSLLDEFRNAMLQNKTIKLIGKELIGSHEIFDIDFGKLVFVVNSNDITCENLFNTLREQWSIELEMHGLNHLIAMTSIADCKSNFDKLAKAINTINKSLKFVEKRYTIKNINIEMLQAVKLRHALFSNFTYCPLEKCENEISAGYLIPYPPGIPLVAPGEIINREAINYIVQCLEMSINVVGMQNGKIKITDRVLK